MSLINFKKRTLILKDAKGRKAKLAAEIADNPLKHMLGLMFRKSLGEDEGMLFAFNDEKQRSLWMLNVTMQLTALFFDASRKVVEIIHMKPCSSLLCPVYKSKSKAKYILEVRGDFTERYNMRNGMLFKLF